MADIRPNWVIFDPLITIATWKQLEHTDEGQELSDYLGNLYYRYECSQVLVNHAVKMQRKDQTRPSEWMLGSFPLRATAAGYLGLTRDRKTEQRRLVVQSNLLGLDHSFVLDWEGSGQGPDEWLSLTLLSETGTPGRPWLDDLVGLPYPVTLGEMAEKLGMPEVTKKFRKRVDAAVEAGMLKRAGKGPHGVQIFDRA